MMKKNIEFNESIFVLYHTLSSIHQNFDGRFPPDIEKEINKLIRKLIDILDSDIDDSYEIEDIKYYQQLLLVPNTIEKNIK